MQPYSRRRAHQNDHHRQSLGTPTLSTPGSMWAHAVQNSNHMAFAVGDRVAHPSRPEWGPGEILAVSGESKYTIYFAQAGQKLLKDVALVRLTGPESSHPLL